MAGRRRAKEGLRKVVEGMFRARRGWFGEKRKSGARKMRGLLEG